VAGVSHDEIIILKRNSMRKFSNGMNTFPRAVFREKHREHDGFAGDPIPDKSDFLPKQ
jgi:hypothetical protein